MSSAAAGRFVTVSAGFRRGRGQAPVRGRGQDSTGGRPRSGLGLDADPVRRTIGRRWGAVWGCCGVAVFFTVRNGRVAARESPVAGHSFALR